ncbi:hypothetical protein PHLGIDRAFT_113319 [Phlebiopsis gigantea 11061_1 CR5-6]|uniref:Golgi apparatus membrane protein TVP38 n=1 Tax=Phlebiopsis gigantea (strain 11061_1 CR5-6) TaxID=745531 RepID=A0A0C3P430_PHLG1|nr:hypothetical protein PHLGIDRAFT_113319 [Phlebiopsis gigantea 11061_1 CR5-6]
MFKHYLRTTWLRYKKLPIGGKLLIWSLVVFYICLGTFLVVVGADRIAQTMYNLAQKVSHLRFGWAILLAAMVLISFPPAIGHTTLTTLCGFAYGMKGFYIAAAGSVLGSALAFIVLRFLFGHRLKKWSRSNEKWQALESVIKARGLPLIMLIRASPFPPWVYANSLFASIEAVALWQFIIATTMVFPKVALHVFIGSRLAALSDGETRRHMDTRTKVMNGVLVGTGILVAAFTSWFIYRAMTQHIRHLEGIPADVDELAAEAVEDAAEGAPLLGNYSNDSLDDGSVSTVRPGRVRSVSPQP